MEKIVIMTIDGANWRDILLAGMVQALHDIVPGLEDIPDHGEINLKYERQGGGAKRDKPRKVRVRGKHSLTITGNREAGTAK